MSKTLFFDVFESEIGPLTVVVNQDGAVTELWTSDGSSRFEGKPQYVRKSEAIARPRLQLEEYARGERTDFDLDLAPDGSPFQHQIWGLLRQIPYGQTRTYGDLAKLVGNPNGSRAVGRANATNPISIVVPCHRVIGSSGALTGYAGGLPMKRKLLELEGVLMPDLFSE